MRGIRMMKWKEFCNYNLKKFKKIEVRNYKSLTFDQ